MLFMDPNSESLRLCNGETMPHSSTSNGRETAANGAKDRSAFWVSRCKQDSLHQSLFAAAATTPHDFTNEARSCQFSLGRYRLSNRSATRSRRRCGKVACAARRTQRARDQCSFEISDSTRRARRGCDASLSTRLGQMSHHASSSPDATCLRLVAARSPPSKLSAEPPITSAQPLWRLVKDGHVAEARVRPRWSCSRVAGNCGIRRAAMLQGTPTRCIHRSDRRCRRLLRPRRTAASRDRPRTIARGG